MTDGWKALVLLTLGMTIGIIWGSGFAHSSFVDRLDALECAVMEECE